MKGKRPGIASTILKNKVRGQAIPNVRTYPKATVLKIVWYWQKDRPMEWNKKSRNRLIEIQSTGL